MLLNLVKNETISSESNTNLLEIKKEEINMVDELKFMMGDDDDDWEDDDEDDDEDDMDDEE